ncbi:N-6 DNA methylase (fragment) [Crenothrix polyspora]|uniref:site-specific DNA-methyltransferase (adenine-specific) n=1 Tax=Crenothrix polyspora TaxID=360316 RepID=A0A1R4HFH6_9GAMM
MEKLTVSTELLKKFKTLYDYDFDNDIGTPVLGHIFEQSIADLDEIYEAITEEQELQGNVKSSTSTSGKRKQDGIVYTPEFITDYIIKHTLGGYLEQKKTGVAHEQDSAAYWLEYRSILAKTRVLDPACGSGAFLIGAFKYLKAEYDFVNRRLPGGEGANTDLFGLDLEAGILKNNLFGVDLNAESIEITQLALWLETAEKGKKLNPLDDNIKQGNSIIHHKNADKQAFVWKGIDRKDVNNEFSKVMETGGFDVILGNPPYVRQERLTAIKPYLQKHYQTYHGVADLYTYFFELGLNLLKKGGRLGYISSSTFFRTNSGTPLREFLKVQSNLQTVIDFGDYPVFDGVTTYPAILIMEKPERLRKSAPKSEFNFLNITAKKDPQHNALKQQLQSELGVMKQTALSAEAWQLEDERFANLRQKITKGYKTLKEVYGSPLYGIKTGLSEAFVINQQQYEHLKQDDPDGKILKLFLEGKDLKRWRAESRDLYLILFPKGWTHRQLNYTEGDVVLTEIEAWRYLQRNYPKIAEYLSAYATRGRKRGDKGYFWWELRSCAYYERFEEPKIVYNRFMPHSLFWFDSTNNYHNDALYFIPAVGYYELGLLNSSLYWYLLTANALTMSGGFYQVHGNVLEKMPIPTSTDEQKSHIANLAQQCQTNAQARYELEQKVQRRLLQNLRPANNGEPLNTKLNEWWKLATVTELATEAAKAFKLKKYEGLNVDLYDLIQQDKWEKYLNDNTHQWQAYTQTIKSLEQQINSAVYALFKLTSEEIGLIERG